MKFNIKAFSISIITFLLLYAQVSGSWAYRAETPVASGLLSGTIFLVPGDSKSIDFIYDGLLWKSASYNNTFLIYALISDNQIHKLSIDFTPQGDVGTDIGYFTTGVFIYEKDGAVKFLEFVQPQLSYGSEPAQYIIDAYPAISIGVIFSAVVVEYADFNFPLNMILNVTLSH